MSVHQSLNYGPALLTGAGHSLDMKYQTDSRSEQLRDLCVRAARSALEKFQTDPRNRSSTRLYELAERAEKGEGIDADEMAEAHLEALMLAKMADRFLSGMLLNMPSQGPQGVEARRVIIKSFDSMADRAIADLNKLYQEEATRRQQKKESERN